MLTKRNIQVLKTILKYARQYHCWPSRQELGDRLGVTRNAIAQHLTKLTAHSYVALVPAGEQSGWRITQEGYSLLNTKPVTINHNRAPRRIRASKGKLSHYTSQQRLKQRYTTATMADGTELYQQ